MAKQKHKRPNKRRAVAARKKETTVAKYPISSEIDQHEGESKTVAAPEPGVMVTWLGPPDEKTFQGVDFVKDKPVSASDLPPEVVEACRNYPTRFKVG